MAAPVLRLRRRRRNDDGLELRRVGRRCLAPTGQGALRGAEATLFAPVGQRRCCVARLVLAGSLRNAVYEAICPSGRAGRRAGRRGKTALRIRAHSSRAGRRARSTGGRRRWALRARRKLPALPAAASFSQPSRGETGGLCPHPPKGPVPWVSLFGEPAHISPVSPSPQTPQAASPCSWTCRRLYPPPSHQKRKEASMPPARGAWMRRHGAEGAGCRHCRPGIILPPPIRARGRRCMRLCPACCQRCR